ncbi:MAG TPA: T9SS type A sorting domain-containing protein [Bacteroidia bacterium]|nr:T9SS type A sorting domain-containing protein [Bacteroidia bacterium]
MKKIIKNLKTIPLLFGFFLCTSAVAQNAGEIDPTFNPTDRGFDFGLGANQAVKTTAVQTDGKILIGGEFKRYNGAQRKGIARILPDGWVDTTFNYVPTTFITEINSIALQTDGKIIAGGNVFTRLLSDGAIDNTFYPAVEGTVNKVVVQNDGKILIGGEFNYYDNRDRKNIARLNADGTLDTVFKVGTGANDIVTTIAAQVDGKVLIGGDFTSYNGSSVNHIARLNTDGSLDTTFHIGTGTDQAVKSISIQTDGKIIVGGTFSEFNGATRTALVRLNTTGEIDSTFLTPTFYGVIYATMVQTDGKIVVGGYVLVASGSGTADLIRVNADGTLDATFNPIPTVTGYIYSISQQSDAKIVIGGIIGSYDNVIMNGVARVKTDGYLDKTFNIQTGSNNPIQDIVELENGKLLLAGEIYTYNGKTQKYFTRINADGSNDDTFHVNMVGYQINSIAVRGDHKIVIGGGLTLARMNEDGTVDASFVSGIGRYSTVNKVLLQGESKVYIAGTFTEYDSVSRNGIARLNDNGSLDNSFNPGTGANQTVQDIALQSDGKVIVVGEFTSFNTVAKNYIVRLNKDGSIDPTFNAGGVGANGYYIAKVVIQPDGKIIIVGSITSYNGVTVNKIARLNSDGTLDTTFNSGSAVDKGIYSISLQQDGKIIIGGEFTKYNGISSPNLARLLPDGTFDTEFNVGTGPNYYLTKTTVQRDGKILIAGAFTDYNKIGRNRITRLIGESTTTGLKELSARGKSFTVFPNPSNTAVTLNFGSDIKNGKLNILNELGQVYKTISFSGNKLPVQDAQLAPGIYFFQVTSGSDLIGTEKVIVQ